MPSDISKGLEQRRIIKKIPARPESYRDLFFFRKKNKEAQAQAI